MAGRGRVPWIVLAGVAWLLALGIVRPSPGHAAAPSPSPSPAAGTLRPPTCSERYPVDGPAGIDLLLGCVVNELVNHYTGAGAGPDAQPPPISAYALPIAAGTAGIILSFLGIRAVRRSAGRRLAPVLPATWWSCPGCRSLNAAAKAACYRCGRAWEPSAAELSAGAEPLAPQSFGRRADAEAPDRRPGPGVER